MLAAFPLAAAADSARGGADRAGRRTGYPGSARRVQHPDSRLRAVCRNQLGDAGVSIRCRFKLKKCIGGLIMTD